MAGGTRRAGEESGQYGFAANNRLIGRGWPEQPAIICEQVGCGFPFRRIVQIGIMVDETGTIPLDRAALVGSWEAHEAFGAAVCTAFRGRGLLLVILQSIRREAGLLLPADAPFRGRVAG